MKQVKFFNKPFVILFKICSACHTMPQSYYWLKQPQTKGLHVFHVAQRSGEFVHWEPIYVGTNAEPEYDERLSWEGRNDKMTQVHEIKFFSSFWSNDLYGSLNRAMLCVCWSTSSTSWTTRS